MSDNQPSSSHGKLIVVVLAAALIIVLALVSAFLWPGWALKQNANPAPSAQTATSLPTTATISAKPLPTNASQLLKAMPDSVLNYARTEAAPSANWTASNPLEEYTLTYSTGNQSDDVMINVAQWSAADGAKTQYDALVKALSGSELGAGNVKVSGNVTGSYVMRVDASNGKNAVAVWQNDTVVFKATGLKQSVERLVQKFPL